MKTKEPSRGFSNAASDLASALRQAPSKDTSSGVPPCPAKPNWPQVVLKHIQIYNHQPGSDDGQRPPQSQEAVHGWQELDISSGPQRAWSSLKDSTRTRTRMHTQESPTL